MKNIISKIIGLTLISNIWAQFVNVNVELDLRRLNESDIQLFDTFADDIEKYLLNTQFSADVNDLNITTIVVL